MRVIFVCARRQFAELLAEVGPVPVLISWIEFQSDAKMVRGLASSYFNAFIHETGEPVKYEKSNHEELRRFHAGETSKTKTRRMLARRRPE